MPRKNGQHSQRGSSGGAAMLGGADYQNRVAAWVAVQMLAGRDAPGVGPGGRIVALRSESGEAMDDLLVGSEGGAYSFVQAKRSIQLSSATNSDFASVIEQAVKQIISSRDGAGSVPWSRPLVPQQDRLVLVTSRESSAPIIRHLRTVLDRGRTLDPNQSIEAAGQNSDESDALKKLRAHITRAWKAVVGTDASPGDERHVMSLLYVAVIDDGSGSETENSAMETLGAFVLARQDLDQERAAWALLYKQCAEDAKNRKGTDISVLRDVLLRGDILLKGRPAYQADIDCLRLHTDLTLEDLAEHARIEVGGQRIEIERKFIGHILGVIESGSLVITGDPGAGKSGALYSIAKALRNDGFDVVCLAADRIEAASLPNLRNELGLDHELLDVLCNWDGARPGFLLIDALDATRGEPAKEMLLQLSRRVSRREDRWRVVVCVRRYDLSHGHAIRSAFPGKPLPQIPASYRDAEFSDLPHLCVRTLSDAEFTTVTDSSAQLKELYQRAGTGMRELLRVPFNLRIAAELLDAGVLVQSMSAMRTQRELLDRYWDVRALRGGSDGFGRENLLQVLTAGMVKARRLHIPRQEAVATSGSGSLAGLLSDHVLVEWSPPGASASNKQYLAFSHNYLFDFAVLRHFLPPDHAELIARLSAEPDLVLVVRPSIVLCFVELWNQNRDGFWNLTFDFANAEGLPHVAKVIPAGVVVSSAAGVDDLAPLIAALNGSGQSRAEAAAKTFSHVVGRLLTRRAGDAPLVGDGAGPWVGLLHTVCQRLSPGTVFPAQALMDALKDRIGEATGIECALIGRAARVLLCYVWKYPDQFGQLAPSAIKAVCAAIWTDAPASAEVLRFAIDPGHIAERGYYELKFLAREVPGLARWAPDFAADLYGATFGWEEKDEGLTALTGSQIFALTSTRRQDFESARWELGQCYKKFFEIEPVAATRAMLAVVSDYCRSRHSGDEPSPTFPVNGIEASVIPDYSRVWLRNGGHDRQQQERILKDGFRGLEQLCGQPGRADTVIDLVTMILAEGRHAAIWNKLLMLGSSQPSVADQLRQLTWARPLLLCDDVEEGMTAFLAAVYPTMDADERDRVEHAIITLPDGLPENRKAVGEYLRDRYVRAVWTTSAETEEFRAVADQLRASDEAERDAGREAGSHDQPPVRFGPGFGGLGFQQIGPPGSAPAEPEDLDYDRIRAFAASHANDVPPTQTARDLLPSLQSLWARLTAEGGANPDLKDPDLAWGYVAGACSAIARIDPFDCGSELGALVKAILLRAARHPKPEAQEGQVEQFDRSPSWGAPIPRIEAAGGILALVSNAQCTDSTVVDMLDLLARDPVPAVRFQIAQRATWLHANDATRMWDLIELFGQDESTQIRKWAVAAACRLSSRDPDRASSLIVEVMDRADSGLPGAANPIKECVTCLTQIFVLAPTASAAGAIDKILDGLPASAERAVAIPSALREILQGSPAAVSDSERPARTRALGLFTKLSHRVSSLMRGFATRLQSGDTLDDRERTEFHSCINLSIALGSEVAVVCGALSRDAGPVEVTPARARLFHEIRPILEHLSEIGISRLTYDLVNSLETFIAVDPPAVFRLIGTTVHAGRHWGYQLDPMAIDQIARIVERYLADYRAALQSDADCQSKLRQMLDLFISAGWPAALNLSYRLDEIYR